MEKVGWQDVPVLAMETVGADCFNKSIEADKVVTIPDITRLAIPGTWNYHRPVYPLIHVHGITQLSRSSRLL